MMTMMMMTTVIKDRAHDEEYPEIHQPNNDNHDKQTYKKRNKVKTTGKAQRQRQEGACKQMQTALTDKQPTNKTCGTQSAGDEHMNPSQPSGGRSAPKPNQANTFLKS